MEASTLSSPVDEGQLIDEGALQQAKPLVEVPHLSLETCHTRLHPLQMEFIEVETARKPRGPSARSAYTPKIPSAERYHML